MKQHPFFKRRAMIMSFIQEEKRGKLLGNWLLSPKRLKMFRFYLIDEPILHCFFHTVCLIDSHTDLLWAPFQSVISHGVSSAALNGTGLISQEAVNESHWKPFEGYLNRVYYVSLALPVVSSCVESLQSPLRSLSKHLTAQKSRAVTF